MWKYYLLVDEINNGVVIKCQGSDQYQYSFGENEWIETGLLLLYHTEGNLLYEKFIEIDENLAEEKTMEMELSYRELNDKLVSMAIRHIGEVEYKFSNLETNIVYLSWVLGEKIVNVKELDSQVGNKHISIAVGKLRRNSDFGNEECIKELRKDLYTNTIAQEVINAYIVAKDNTEYWMRQLDILNYLI